jgi:hypothetical protein
MSVSGLSVLKARTSAVSRGDFVETIDHHVFRQPLTRHGSSQCDCSFVEYIELCIIGRQGNSALCVAQNLRGFRSVLPVVAQLGVDGFSICIDFLVDRADCCQSGSAFFELDWRQRGP